MTFFRNVGWHMFYAFCTAIFWVSIEAAYLMSYAHFHGGVCK